MTDKKATLLKLNENLNILKEREAKYGGSAPLDLLNQIGDHEQAITLTRQIITGELTEEEWREALKPLLLAINNGQVINVEVDTYVAGDVKGDMVAADKVVGDKIFGNKIITNIYEALPPPLPPAEAKERRDLGILLSKVKQFWIEGVLEKSVHNMALIDLGKETQAEAVAHAWEQVLELPDQSRQTLPLDKKISQIFDEMNRALLILGDPGSGKTITLLQLAHDLIAQAEQDKTFSQPIPVIFNLSSWVKEQSITDWLMVELASKYQIPKRISRPWLENHRLLPLLDGLDEVEHKDQPACVEAINQFVEEFGLSGLVVCSRLKEYINLPVRLRLNGAIRLQPLTLEQVYDYLETAGSKLDALRMALQEDDSLKSLARSPLILGIMSLAYQDIHVEVLTNQSHNTVELRRKHLFDTYIDRMFKRKGQGIKPYKDEQTKRWLSWLARQMNQNNRAIFLIEQLQPSWLSSRIWSWWYVLGSRLIIGLIAGLILGPTFWMAGDEIFFRVINDPSFTRPINWLILWLVTGLFLGLTLGVIDGLRFEMSSKSVAVKKVSSLWHIWINIIAVGLSLGLIGGLIVGIIGGQILGLMFGLIFGLFLGVFLGLRGSRQNLMNDIQTVEALSGSWERAKKSLALGLVGGLIFGVSLGLILSLNKGEFRQNIRPILGLSERLSFVLLAGLRWGMIGGVIGAMFGGVNSKIVETKTVSNQGIRLSLRNAISVGLSWMLVLGLTEELTLGLIYGLSFGLNGGLIFGVMLGLLAALWYGGLDVIQHYTLRLILWSKGYTPHNYIYFLDYATERVFLQKVGGGYIFIHRLLLEHFAMLNETKQDLDETSSG